MKKIIYIAFFLSIAGFANADPHFTCDPQAGVTAYKIVWDSGGEEISTANADGSANVDLAGIPEGENSGTIYAGKEWILDGIPQGVYEWGDGVPFVLTKPDTAGSPQNKKLK